MDFRRTLSAGGRTYAYFSIAAAEDRFGNLATMPRSLRVLLENLLRHDDGQMIAEDALESITAWRGGANTEIGFRPVRVLMQDFTGVPAIVDLAAMRDAMTAMGGDPAHINPLIPVDLVIDHSVSVDTFGKSDPSLEKVPKVSKKYSRCPNPTHHLASSAAAFAARRNISKKFRLFGAID